MTATMILNEIHALPVREKEKLFQQLERERGQTEVLDDACLFDKAKREMAGEKLDGISEASLLQLIEDIGRRMKTSLSAEEMNAARFEGRE
jgi:transcriptional regulator with AAA-type ATPase domain